MYQEAVLMNRWHPRSTLRQYFGFCTRKVLRIMGSKKFQEWHSIRFSATSASFGRARASTEVSHVEKFADLCRQNLDAGASCQEIGFWKSWLMKHVLGPEPYAGDRLLAQTLMQDVP